MAADGSNTGASTSALVELEAFDVLRTMARSLTNAIPPELLARHVLDVTAGGDWYLAEAAMQALRRRARFAERDELFVAKRPARGRRLGRYATRRRGHKTSRPYQTHIYSVDPIRVSCDCPDFVRSSLGVCKHALVILQDIYAGKRKLAQARAEQRRGCEVPELGWMPVRPLTGRGDWLARVRYQPRGKNQTRSFASAFDPRTGLVCDAHTDTPSKRSKLVSELRAAVRRRPSSADPALGVLLEREDARVARSATARTVLTKASWQRGLGRKLYKYQREGVERFLQRGQLLLADDMGLGKTTQAVAACHALFHQRRVRRGLVIVPASLKSQWLREWQSTTDVPATIVEGSPTERAEQYAGLERGFLVLNYEQLLRDVEPIHAMQLDMVVLDEAQRIKNWATKTAAYVKSLRVPYRLVLTGTPMENRLEELASIFDWVDDMALEPKWRLGPWHSVQDSQGDRASTVVGARNLDTLRERIAPAMLRRIRREVLDQLPERTDTRIPVELTNQQRIAHAELDQPIASLLARAQRRPLRQPEFLRLMSLMNTQRIICNGMAQLDFDEVWPGLDPAGPSSERQIESLFAPKLAELRALVRTVALEQGRKLVIFSQWRRMLRLAGWAIADVLRDAGMRAVYFTGAESQKQRTRSVVELHDDRDTTVMLLSDAGGVGLNLQRAASCCINLELPWNPAVLEQRIGRIHRLGQRDPIDVYNLVSDEGIETRIAMSVANKKALFTGLFDGNSNELVFDQPGSTMAMLETLVEPAVPTGELEPPDADDESLDELDDHAASDLLERANDTHDAPVEPETGNGNGRARPPASPDAVATLLASLRISTGKRGNVIIEAPAETAGTLALLFRTMAEQLESQQHTG